MRLNFFSLLRSTWLAILLISSMDVSARQAPTAAPDVATTPTATRPKQVGEKAPDATLHTMDGQAVQLADLYSSAPTVLVFYRGGWCPYCNKQLGRISAIEKEIRAAGLQIVAVSPDAPALLRETAEKAGMDYSLMSDSDADAIRAFGLAFRVDDATIEQYRGFNIDLEKSAGGQNHHILPVPSVYIIDQQGLIRYAYSNPDYKQRANEQEILKAALEITQ